MMRSVLHRTGLHDFINTYLPNVVGFFFVLFVYITISVFTIDFKYRSDLH
jgi:hypothetical protein